MTEQWAARQVLVVQPGDDDPLGRFSGWLADAGIDFVTVRPFAGDTIPDRLEADGLIVLGGEMSSNDTATHPWLERVRRLMRDAVERGRPTLGICLGGQLLAQALGGTVVRGASGTEAGLVTVTTTDAAQDDAIFHGLGRDFAVASMHGDEIEVLPDGAELLGTSTPYAHQAFRAAPNAWGVQFHPEIEPATYASWADDFHSPDPEEADRVTRGINDLGAADARVRATAEVIAARFAALVTANAAQRAS